MMLQRWSRGVGHADIGGRASLFVVLVERLVERRQHTTVGGRRIVDGRGGTERVRDARPVGRDAVDEGPRGPVPSRSRQATTGQSRFGPFVWMWPQVHRHGAVRGGVRPCSRG
jgi:hypothetical protein